MSNGPKTGLDTNPGKGAGARCKHRLLARKCEDCELEHLREVEAAAKRIVEAWNHPDEWENDDLYDRITDLEAVMEQRR